MWKRALQDTKKFFGWNLKSITFPIFYGIGLLVYWAIGGTGAVREAIVQFLAFGLVPVGGFTILLFFWNLSQASSRIKLDNALEEVRRLKEENAQYKKSIELQEKQREEFFFEPIDSLTLKTGSVQLTVMFKARPDKTVDRLWLDIGGMRFTPSDWRPFVVSNQYTGNWMFDLAGKVKQGETYIGKLIARSAKKEHESREFNVYT